MMNGLLETMANLLSYLFDPSLRCKLYPHIYVKVTKFDPLGHEDMEEDGWQEDISLSLS